MLCSLSSSLSYYSAQFIVAIAICLIPFGQVRADGAKRAAVTSKVGVDLTPYFNVEGFVRHLYRNAQTDPQDPLSFLRIESIDWNPHSGAWLRFTAMSNTTYTVQSCSFATLENDSDGKC